MTTKKQRKTPRRARKHSEASDMLKGIRNLAGMTIDQVNAIKELNLDDNIPIERWRTLLDPLLTQQLTKLNAIRAIADDLYNRHHTIINVA